MSNDLESDLRRRQERHQRWTERWTQHGLHGPSDPHYRLFVAAWALACVARFTLLEPRHGLAWYAATALLFVGAIGLLKFGGRIAWVLCWLGLAWPYFFLRDWMTQSAVMLALATVGVLTVHARASAKTLLKSAHWIVGATYLIAAFHKLNTGFLDPTLSCATYGWDKLHLAIAAFPRGHAVRLPTAALNALPVLVLLTEATIGVLLLTPYRTAALAGILLGLLFHIPLTLVLAPAFVFVMALGYVAALPAGDVAVTYDALQATAVRRAAAAVIITITVLSGFVWGGTELVLGIKLGLITAACIAVGVLIAGQPPHPTGAERAARQVRRMETTPLAFAMLAAFVLNAATPYLGTQTQHTGAMLSNLRIDEGCWNHVLVPESLRQVDPYLRIDTARIGAGQSGTARGQFTEREFTLTSTLWTPSAMRLIQRNWCRPHTRPIAITGTFMGQPVVIDDLCDADAALPRGVSLLGGEERLPNFLTLQKNLTRECPTACIH